MNIAPVARNRLHDSPRAAPNSFDLSPNVHPVEADSLEYLSLLGLAMQREGAWCPPNLLRRSFPLHRGNVDPGVNMVGGRLPKALRALTML